MKCHVLLHHYLQAGRLRNQFLDKVLKNLLQLCQLLLGLMADCQPQRGDFNHLAKLLQLAVGVALREHNAVNQRIEHLLGNSAADKGSLSPANFQNAISHQNFHGLPHRVSADL